MIPSGATFIGVVLSIGLALLVNKLCRTCELCKGKGGDPSDWYNPCPACGKERDLEDL